MKRCRARFVSMALAVALVMTSFVMSPLTADAANNYLLTKVCGISITQYGGDGSTSRPFTESITVPYNKTSVTNSDLEAQGGVALLDSGFNDSVNSYALTEGAPQRVYIGASLYGRIQYYRVSVTRQLPPSEGVGLVSVAGKAVTITGGAGTTVNPYTGVLSAPVLYGNSSLSISEGELLFASGWNATFCNSSFTTAIDPVGLSVGANSVYIVSYKYSSTSVVAKAFKLSVVRSPQSGEASLLYVMDNSIDGAWGGGTRNNPLRKDLHVSNALVAIGREDIRVSPYATFEMFAYSSTNRYGGVPVDSIPLTVGASTTLDVKVTAENGNVLYYSVGVTRAAPAVNIAEIYKVLDTGVAPVGGEGTTSYPFRVRVSVPFAKEKMYWNQIMATGTKSLYSSAAFSVEVTSPNEIILNHGSNFLYVKVVASDGSKTVYYALEVYRELPSDDATLYSIGGSYVMPVSGDGTVGAAYSAHVVVPASLQIMSNYIVKGVAAGATHKAYKDAGFSDEYSTIADIPVGDSRWYFKVTAQDGATVKYYDVTVTRPQPSHDASIHSVAGNAPTAVSGSGSSADDLRVMRVTVPNNKSRIVVVDDVVTHIGAGVFMYPRFPLDGTEAQLAYKDLIVGENHLYIMVISESYESFFFYDVIVTRQAAGSGDNGGTPGGISDGKDKNPSDTAAGKVTALRTPVKTLYLKKGKAFTPPVAFDGRDANGKAWGYGKTAKLKWTSSKKSVASVNAVSGKISPKKKGTAYVTAKALNGKSLKFKVVVVTKAKKLSKVAFVKPPKSLKIGATRVLKIKLTPAKATGVKITFKSSKPSIIRVDKAGKLYALKKGSVKITLKAGGKSKVVRVRVR